MKSAVLRTVRCGLVAACLLGSGMDRALAQRAAPGAGAAGANREPPPIKLRKLNWERNVALVRTPEYRSSSSRAGGLPQEWWCIGVSYDSAPDWIDELTFQYHVLAQTKVDGKKAFSLYKTRIAYIDIEKGRNHLATAYLRPRTVKRYGEPVAVTVQVYHKGDMVAEVAEARAKLPQSWWTESRVIDSESLTVRDGYLLNRAQTPFMLVDIDSYETIK